MITRFINQNTVRYTIFSTSEKAVLDGVLYE